MKLSPLNPNVAAAKRLLELNGYVVIKDSSYRKAQERQRIAEALHQYALQEVESARAWALDCLATERKLSDRCTYLYGVARSRGATDAELRSPSVDNETRSQSEV